MAKICSLAYTKLLLFTFLRDMCLLMFLFTSLGKNLTADKTVSLLTC